MKRYGLNLRVPPSQQKKQPTRPPLPPPPRGFRDEDEDDVEREIARQASRNRALKEIEEQHKKALEEDPSVFDYDGVYDEMKQKTILPRAQDREEKKPKYILNLMKKAEERQREHEIIFERKLVKERSKEDHLYADKDKFVTSSYKKKLAEQAKWMEEERIRQLKEEKDDVTKKGDISDFYFNLEKNVAFGGEKSKREKRAELMKPEKPAESERSEKDEEKVAAGTSEKGPSLTNAESAEANPEKEGREGVTSTHSKRQSDSAEANPVSSAPVTEKGLPDQPSTDQPKSDHHKRTQDALAAAKERFMARKKAKQQ